MWESRSAVCVELLNCRLERAPCPPGGRRAQPKRIQGVCHFALSAEASTREVRAVRGVKPTPPCDLRPSRPGGTSDQSSGGKPIALATLPDIRDRLGRPCYSVDHEFTESVDTLLPRREFTCEQCWANASHPRCHRSRRGLIPFTGSDSANGRTGVGRSDALERSAEHRCTGRVCPATTLRFDPLHPVARTQSHPFSISCVRPFLVGLRSQPSCWEPPSRFVG